MTRERAKELLPVIQAYAEGKEVDFHCQNDPTRGWESTPDPKWSDYYNYRIKPEPPRPREVWIITSKLSRMIYYESYEEAKRSLRGTSLFGEPVLFREVIQ